MFKATLRASGSPGPPQSGHTQMLWATERRPSRPHLLPGSCQGHEQRDSLVRRVCAQKPRDPLEGSLCADNRLITAGLGGCQAARTTVPTTTRMDVASMCPALCQPARAHQVPAAISADRLSLPPA